MDYDENDGPGFTANTPAFHSLIASKDWMVAIANCLLKSAMSNRYHDIVIYCLTCLDEDNGDFADITRFEDEHGVVFGVQYIEKVNTPIFTLE